MLRSQPCAGPALGRVLSLALVRALRLTLPGAAYQAQAAVERDVVRHALRISPQRIDCHKRIVPHVVMAVG
jgi:hypothetical protein